MKPHVLMTFIGLLLFVLWGTLSTVQAHSEQESPALAEIFPQRTFLMVRITGNGGDLADLIHANAHSLSSEQAGRLTPQTEKAAREYFQRHFMLKQGGQRLPDEFLSLRLWNPDNVDASRMRFEVRIRFQRDVNLANEPLFVTNALFDYLGKAQTIVVMNGEVKTLNKAETTRFDAALANRTVMANILDWLKNGFFALFGWEHLVFILAVLLAAAHLPVKQIAEAVAALTLSMGAAFAVSLMKQLSPSISFIDLGIAVSILGVGIFNWLLARRAKAGDATAHSQAQLGFALFILSVIFGAAHGFRFVPLIVDKGLPEEALGACLIAFVLGLALAQGLLLTATGPLLRRFRVRFDTNAQYGGMDWVRATRFASMIFIAFGGYHVLERWLG